MGVITAAVTWVPGGPDGLLDDLLARRPRLPGRWQTAADPERPRAVAAGDWRRMSRLSRMVLATAVPLVEARPDRQQIALVWGNTMGELVPVSRFLERLYTEGPQHTSPLNFQNSVTNAPASHLNIALGMHGLSETLSAGGATGLAALLRGLDLVALGEAPAVLVVAGDDLNDTTRRAWELLGEGPAVGECMTALVLEREGSGPQVEVGLGVHPAALTLARRTPLPREEPLSDVPGAVAPEDCLGLVPSAGLTLVAALAAAGRAGAVVDQDGPFALTAEVSP